MIATTERTTAPMRQRTGAAAQQRCRRPAILVHRTRCRPSAATACPLWTLLRKHAERAGVRTHTTALSNKAGTPGSHALCFHLCSWRPLKQQEVLTACSSGPHAGIHPGSAQQQSEQCTELAPYLQGQPASKYAVSADMADSARPSACGLHASSAGGLTSPCAWLSGLPSFASASGRLRQPLVTAAMLLSRGAACMGRDRMHEQHVAGSPGSARGEQMHTCLAGVRSGAYSSLQQAWLQLLTARSKRAAQCFQALHLFIPATDSFASACISVIQQAC